MFLEGKKIYLRSFCEEDIKIWHAWFNDQEVTSGMDKGFFPNTIEDQQRFFQNMYSDRANLQLAIVLKENNELIGSIGLHQINFIHGTADISVLIGERKYWGKGLTKEAMKLMIAHAFNKLNLHKLTGGMYETNVASKRLFESLGFKKEGELREQVKVKGKYISVLKYGLIYDEFIREKKC